MTKGKTILTYLDAGVLILGVRGTPDEKLRVHALLTDPVRAFVFSDYLVLEVMPKAVYFKHLPERQFYESYFNLASRRQPSTADAYATASKYGLAAMDALHLQAALDAKADELITTEKPSKPLYRARGVKVVDFTTI